MLDNKYYYDEQIKNHFYEKNTQSFTKIKENLSTTTLSSLLSLLTKQALTDIAKRLDIKGYSKLGKDALVALINENILKDIDCILKDLSYKELSLLKESIKSDYSNYTFSIEELSTIGGLCSLGLMYKVSLNNSLYLVVPSDLHNSVKTISSKDYMTKLKETSMATNFIDGILTHYGLIQATDLYSIITNTNIEYFSEDKIDFYINYILRSYEAFTEVGAIVHPYVFSPEDIYEEVKVRQTIPYNFDDINYYITLGDSLKNIWTTPVEELKSILLNYKFNKTECDSILTELIFFIKNDIGTQSIIDLLISKGIPLDDETENSELITAIANVYNSTGIWTLKGLTPIELEKRRTTIVKKDKEPGRNDVCPCGSGKKYKKCCMNK